MLGQFNLTFTRNQQRKRLSTERFNGWINFYELNFNTCNIGLYTEFQLVEEHFLP